MSEPKVEPKNMDLIQCPQCKQQVDVAFYPQHIESGHKLHVINIRGLGGPELVQSNPKGPVMLDIPYLGRLRRDAFMAWSLIMLILGILIAGYYWRVV